MPATYEPIATTTLGSSASQITFSSISGSFTDLRLILTYKQDSSSTVYFWVNNNTGSLYSKFQLQGNGTTATSGRQAATIVSYITSGSDGGQWTLATLDILSYTSSMYKTGLSTVSNDRNGAGLVTRSAHLIATGSAISRLDLFGNGTFSTGTTATLYGILKA